MNHLADLILRIIIFSLFQVKQPWDDRNFLSNDLSSPETTSHIFLTNQTILSDKAGQCEGAASNIILIEGGFLGSTLDHLKYNMKYDGAGEIMQPGQL